MENNNNGEGAVEREEHNNGNGTFFPTESVSVNFDVRWDSSRIYDRSYMLIHFW